MIVKNEADTLPSCLKSIDGIFDEIVIADTGSTDGTLEIAKQYTDKIYHFEWTDDFAAARNFSFSKNSCEYVMWLDADDVLTPEDAESLKKLKEQLDGKIKEVVANYKVGFDENGDVTLEYFRERIFLRRYGFAWRGRIHETITILPDCTYANFSVTHRKVHPTEKGRNLRIFEKMKSEGEDFSARDHFYYGRELFYNDRVEEASDELEAFVDRADAFLENRIDACMILAQCREKSGLDPLPALLRSLEFDEPRAELCCEIGRLMMERKKERAAVFWYQLALEMKPDLSGFSFVNRDCYDYIPCLQLCVLYYSLGDIEKSFEYHQKAAQLKPKSQAVLFNQAFFEKLRKKNR